MVVSNVETNVDHNHVYNKTLWCIVSRYNLIDKLKSDQLLDVWEANEQLVLPVLQEEEAEPCAFWPQKQQPISFESFTVTLRSETRMCLSGEENLIIKELLLQASQVTHSGFRFPFPVPGIGLHSQCQG